MQGEKCKGGNRMTRKPWGSCSECDGSGYLFWHEVQGERRYCSCSLGVDLKRIDERTASGNGGAGKGKGDREGMERIGGDADKTLLTMPTPSELVQ
jgi:hypothetical protein